MQRRSCSGSHSAYTPYNVATASTSISCSTKACIKFTGHPVMPQLLPPALGQITQGIAMLGPPQLRHIDAA